MRPNPTRSGMRFSLSLRALRERAGVRGKEPPGI